MPLQQDRGVGIPIYDSGMPSNRPTDDLPRWLLVLAVVVGLALFLALLRYAVDLLGVVFLIILVGFSIRTASDWLTEGESVSAWGVAAVLTGLIGTLVIGLWLFGSPDYSGTSLTELLPQPIRNGIQWLESNGWGQRVLLTRPGALTGDGRATVDGALPVGSRSSQSAGRTAAGPARSMKTPSLPKHSLRGGTATAAEAEAATTVRRGGDGASARAPGGTSAPSTAGAKETPTQQDAPAIATRTSLRSWPAPAIVGRSVRLTATVSCESQNAPTGKVTFYSDGTTLGSVPVRGTGPGHSEATLITLTLPLGVHEISAEFTGSNGFAGSQASSVTLTVRLK